MIWTTLLAIILIPVYLWGLKTFIAEPLERMAKKHLPEKMALFLIKEHGDKRHA